MLTLTRSGPGGPRFSPGRWLPLVACITLGCASSGGSSGGAGNFAQMFESNPYEQSTFSKWWNGNKSKGDVTLPAAENPSRTAMDEKARRDLEAAKALYDNKEYAKAEPLFATIAKAKSLRQDVTEEALFYRAECQRLQANYRDAEGNLILYIKSYPYGKYTTQANERLFDIANYWLNNTREQMKAYEEQRAGQRSFVMPASWFHFGRDMPFTDVEGHALHVLEEVRLNDIRGKLGEKSLFYIATVKFFREDYKEADFYYSQIVEHYPKSELAAKAMKQSIICKQIANGGTAYDTRLVEKCRNYLEEFSRAYPGKDADWIQKQLVSINYQQADRDFNIGEFYRRTGHPGSAYFYYELVRRRYPNTEYSKKAESRMNELRSRVQEEQRTARADVPAGSSWLDFDVRRLFSSGTPTVIGDGAAAVAPGATSPRLLPPNLGQSDSGPPSGAVGPR